MRFFSSPGLADTCGTGCADRVNAGSSTALGNNTCSWITFMDIDTGETIEFIAGDAVANVGTVRIGTDTIGSSLINKAITFVDINTSDYWVSTRNFVASIAKKI